MERIKDLSKVILREDMIFAEIVETKTSSIIMPDSVKPEFDYMIVLAKGNGVDSLEVGDIVMNASNVDIYEICGKNYAKFSKGNLLFAVKPENFDPSLKKNKFTSKIIH